MHDELTLILENQGKTLEAVHKGIRDLKTDFKVYTDTIRETHSRVQEVYEQGKKFDQIEIYVKNLDKLGTICELLDNLKGKVFRLLSLLVLSLVLVLILIITKDSRQNYRLPGGVEITNGK